MQPVPMVDPCGPIRGSDRTPSTGSFHVSRLHYTGPQACEYLGGVMRNLIGVRALHCTWLMLFALNSDAQQLAHPRPAPVGSWVIIGTTHADHTADHDGIVVQGPGDGFRALKLKVTDAPLTLMKMVVTYDNGKPDNIEVRQNIPRGGETRVIDLEGGRRSIRRIDFWYDTQGLLNGRADVTIFGLK
jgi:hypothetical protein